MNGLTAMFDNAEIQIYDNPYQPCYDVWKMAPQVLKLRCSTPSVTWESFFHQLKETVRFYLAEYISSCNVLSSGKRICHSDYICIAYCLYGAPEQQPAS